MWSAVKAERPEWKPAIGFYSSADDAVTAAHIRMAAAHGIAGFQSCWYRARGNAGHAVTPIFDGFIQGVADRVPNRNLVVWDIFWDNTNPVGDPASSVGDFVDHVATFWITRYFGRPNYLRIDGRPVVVVASAPDFARQLGGDEAARRAITLFRSRVREAGFPGVLLLTANNAGPRAANAQARALGFDAVMAYATPPFTGLLETMDPTDRAVIAAERASWQLARDHSELPTLVTASVGFDARLWSRATLHYLLSAADWEELVRDALETASRRPTGSIGSRLVLLDAWNEFGEGHFIEPTEAYGSRYLDGVAGAVAAVRAQARAAPQRTP